MSSLPDSPKTLTGGLVLMDADGKVVLRTVSFQYNPDTLTRTLTPRGAKIDAGDRLEGLRLIGPPVETLKFEIEFEGADRPQQNGGGAPDSVAPQLADLETIISPAADDMVAADRLAQSGSIEVLPLPSPLLLLILGPNRTLPVRITDFSVVEEAFDTQLDPIRARVNLTVRVLSIDDLVFGTKGAELFMVAVRTREKLAQRQPPNLASLGLSVAP